jgi:3'(2'), 5'-bisphosphate nucleotidase
MIGSSRDDLAAAFGAIVLEAGGRIMALRALAASAAIKPDGSPVTQADLEADQLIRGRLAERMPGIAVVTEEARETHGRAVGRFILVDPLDGTREFIAGRDEFTVNIALIEDGTPLVGAVYAPALEKLYVGGERAFYASLSPDRALPDFKTLQPIAAGTVPRRDWRAVVSRSHLDASTQAWLDAMPIETRCAAGSSMKFCVIAEGGADVYPRLAPTMEWDTAAGQAVLVAAGGSVVGLDGAPLTYGKQHTALCNPSFIAWGKR